MCKANGGLRISVLAKLRSRVSFPPKKLTELYLSSCPGSADRATRSKNAVAARVPVPRTGGTRNASPIRQRNPAAIARKLPAGKVDVLLSAVAYPNVFALDRSDTIARMSRQDGFEHYRHQDLLLVFRAKTPFCK